jgi:hypothetical protein
VACIRFTNPSKQLSKMAFMISLFLVFLQKNGHVPNMMSLTSCTFFAFNRTLYWIFNEKSYLHSLYRRIEQNWQNSLKRLYAFKKKQNIRRDYSRQLRSIMVPTTNSYELFPKFLQTNSKFMFGKWFSLAPIHAIYLRKILLSALREHNDWAWR